MEKEKSHIPLLLYAISIARHQSAREEVAFELENKTIAGRKFVVPSILLLLPLVVPLLAIYQELQKRGSGKQ